MKRIAPALHLIAPLLLAVLPVAGAAGERGSALFELRLRHEQVDDAAFARDAEATTLRARLGLKLVPADGWEVLVEAEHTGHLFGERYNSSANGATGFPAVIDPDNTELNRAQVGWRGGQGISAVLGRQRILHGNHRFIGNVGWRQNEQTFDALDLGWQAAAAGRLRYAYLDRVQRINGAQHPQPALARWDLDSHLLGYTRTIGRGELDLLGLWYRNETLPGTSQRTLAAHYRLDGALAGALRWDLRLSAASQRPTGDGAAQNRADYHLIEAGLLGEGWRLGVSRERLGGDGRYGFQTPLATLHAFNGWADRFLTTPVDGLVDHALSGSRTLGAWTLGGSLRDFRADRGGRRYGRELDLSLGRAFGPQWNLLFKTARFEGRDTLADVDKLWVSLEYRL